MSLFSFGHCYIRTDCHKYFNQNSQRNIHVLNHVYLYHCACDKNTNILTFLYVSHFSLSETPTRLWLSYGHYWVHLLKGWGALTALVEQRGEAITYWVFDPWSLVWLPARAKTLYFATPSHRFWISMLNKGDLPIGLPSLWGTWVQTESLLMTCPGKRWVKRLSRPISAPQLTAVLGTYGVPAPLLTGHLRGTCTAADRAPTGYLHHSWQGTCGVPAPLLTGHLRGTCTTADRAPTGYLHHSWQLLCHGDSKKRIGNRTQTSYMLVRIFNSIFLKIPWSSNMTKHIGWLSYTHIENYLFDFGLTVSYSYANTFRLTYGFISLRVSII